MPGYTLIALPFLIIPALVGLSLLRRPTWSLLPKVAGWLTLKPLLATPLWEVVTFTNAPRPGESVSQPFYFILGITPGVLLTLLIVWSHYRIFAEPHRFALCCLLIIDAVRMVITATLFNSTLGQLLQNFGGLLILLALTMPMLFSLIAYELSQEVKVER